MVLRFLSSTAAEIGSRGDEGELLLLQSQGVSVAIQHPRMTQEHAMSLLRRLSEASPPHSLFMKTVMQAVQKFPLLVGWTLEQLLPKLVQNLVWKNPILWKGFIVFCHAALDQGSCAVLVRLPPEVFKTLLSEDPRFLPVLRKYAKEHSTRVPNLIRRVLREDTNAEKKK